MKFTEQQIQAVQTLGREISVYRDLPAPKSFHESKAKYRFLSGGNRSGKSEANIGYDLSTYALGVHPFRPTPKNAIIWAAADTWPLVGKLLWQEKLSLYFPAHQIASITWHNRQEQIPKELVTIDGVTIEFKAFEQGRTAFEGRNIDAIYADEQCKNDSYSIWLELQARLEKPESFLAWSMTPIRPQAWLEDKFSTLPPGYEVFYANLNDNRISRGGHVADSVIDALINEWPEEVQATRIKGRFASFVGAVYKTFSKDTHVVKRFRIPPQWERYRVIDFGFNNPFVCLWMARDGDNNWYVYNEHYKRQETLRYHADAIDRISGADEYIMTYADHDAQDRAELWQYGIYTSPAKKDVRNGIEAVQRALKVQGNGRPRLQIMDNCPRSIREMAAYHYPDGTDAKDPKDEPVKKDDHTVDAIRYGIYGVEGTAPLIINYDPNPPKVSDDAIHTADATMSDLENYDPMEPKAIEEQMEEAGVWS